VIAGVARLGKWAQTFAARPRDGGHKREERTVAVSVNLSKGLDKAYEDKSLAEILSAPPSALAGLTEKHDELLKGLGINTIQDLGSNKYFAFAGVLVALNGKTG
jgi:hypothetical protein